MSDTTSNQISITLRTVGMLLVAIGWCGLAHFAVGAEGISFAYRFVIVFIAGIFISNMLSNVTVLCIRGY